MPRNGHGWTYSCGTYLVVGYYLFNEGGAGDGKFSSVSVLHGLLLQKIISGGT